MKIESLKFGLVILGLCAAVVRGAELYWHAVGDFDTGDGRALIRVSAAGIPGSVMFDYEAVTETVFQIDDMDYYGFPCGEIFVKSLAPGAGTESEYVGAEPKFVALDGAVHVSNMVVPGMPWLSLELRGDLDSDSDRDLFDVLRLIDIVLHRPPAPSSQEVWAGDMDRSHDLDLFDVLELVDRVIGKDISHRGHREKSKVKYQNAN